jgi:ParB family transcriptional regulator, chromosome partitioning protein
MGDPVTSQDLRRPVGGLGRGLAALIPAAASEGVRELAVDEIEANPRQPRRSIDVTALEGLVESIREHGVIQPVVVVRAGARYQLIAGERRLRATRLAGRSTIPAIVRTADEQQQLALALVENIQRADLNAMDEARAFRQLIDDFGLTQEQVARRIGRSRPAVTNTLRLLDVDPDVQAAVEDGRISEGHARALAGLPSGDTQRAVLATVIERALSVRQTERLMAAWREEREASPAPDEEADPDLQRMESRLREALGTKVSVRPGRSGGRITIAWFDDDDLSRIYERLTGDER